MKSTIRVLEEKLVKAEMRRGVQARSGRYFGDADTNIFNIKMLYC